MRASYGYRWCYVCGNNFKTSGASWASHCRKHVREGKMTERKVYDRPYYYHLEFDIVKGIPIMIEKRGK